jgi:hypothetical protein
MARVFGRCEPTTGTAPFTNLVDQVMSVEPYASARLLGYLIGITELQLARRYAAARRVA